MHYITLVSSQKSLYSAHIATIELALSDMKYSPISHPQWLDKHKAADIQITGRPTKDEMDKLRMILDKYKIDIFCTSAHNRKKKLIIADMDSTIIATETLDELAQYAGIKNEISAITQKAMNGEIDFKQALKQRVSLLKNLPVRTLQDTLDSTIINEGAKRLIKTMKNNGAICVLVSGGFTFFTEKIAQKSYFHHHHGNILEICNNKITGNVKEPILDKDSKLEYLIKYINSNNLDISESMAIGDGANDLPMLQYANLGIGYKPKPLVKENLDNLIIYSNLTSALYAQGYKKEEFM